MSDVEKTANQLLKEFSEDSESQKIVSKTKNSDPFVELKLDLLKFFRDTMKQISERDRLKSRIEEELFAFLERSELNFDQIMTLYRTVGKMSHDSSDSLIGLFKPTPGAPSILASNLSEKDEKKDVYDQLYEEFNAENLQKIEKLNKLINQINFNDNNL